MLFICGGTYSFKDVYGTIHEGICRAVLRPGEGAAVGEFDFPQKKTEIIKQGSDRASQLTLIGRPASPKVGRPRKG